MPFFRFYPDKYLRVCAVNGANTVKMTSFHVTEICVLFLRLRRVRTVHLGFINTENKGQILYIVAHPFQQHFSKNTSQVQINPRHREKEPQNIYSNKTSERQ